MPRRVKSLPATPEEIFVRTRPQVGPNVLADPQPTGVGPLQGGKSPYEGVNPPTSGTKNLGEPKAKGCGQNRGWRGRSSLPGGLGDVSPTPHTPLRGGVKRGRAAHPCRPTHEWDPKPRQTPSKRGRANPRNPPHRGYKGPGGRRKMSLRAPEGGEAIPNNRRRLLRVLRTLAMTQVAIPLSRSWPNSWAGLHRTHASQPCDRQRVGGG